MSARTLRDNLTLAMILGYESVCLSLLSYTLSRGPDGGAVGWLPLWLAGITLLAWHRILLHFDLAERAQGILASALGGGVILSLLMGAVAPGVVAGAVAGPDDWFRAVGDIWKLFSEPVPLTVVLISGGLAWFRAVRLAQTPRIRFTSTSVGSRFRWGLVLLIALLLESRVWGVLPPASSTFVFFGFGLAALALARANEESEVNGAGSLPMDARWVALLVGSVLAMLLLATVATLVFSLSGMGVVLAFFDPLVQVMRLLFLLFVQAVGAILVPVIRTAYENVPPTPVPVQQGAFLTPVPTPATEIPAAAGSSEWLYGVGVLVAIVVMVIVLYRLYSRRRTRLDSPLPDPVTEYSRADTGWTLGGWLRQQAAALGSALQRPARREFGVTTIRDLYRNLLLFGDEHGLSRPAEETPYEYLVPLCQSYPNRREDFFALTDAYVAVHYGEQDFSSRELERLQAAWFRIAGEGTGSGDKN